MMNTIYTTEQYMTQGFTAQEVPMIREHDLLFNEWVRGGKVDNELAAQIETIAEKLGL